MKGRKKVVVKVTPRSYQPTKKELAEPVKINADPQELAKMILSPAKVVEKS